MFVFVQQVIYRYFCWYRYRTNSENFRKFFNRFSGGASKKGCDGNIVDNYGVDIQIFPAATLTKDTNMQF